MRHSLLSRGITFVTQRKMRMMYGDIIYMYGLYRKASTESPLSRAQTERWKPQKGQSYPVTHLMMQGILNIPVQERYKTTSMAILMSNAMHIFLLLCLSFNYLPLLMNLPSASVKLPRHITMKSMSVHIPQPPAVSSMMIPVPVFPT